MFNPFTEAAEDDVEDAELVEQAKNGDRDPPWRSWSCGIRRGSTTSPSAWSSSRTTPRK